ncbi:MAG: 4-hydroxy-3-methylbut-2-enyl diphosphate reductase [Gammaproteobacteria bacterium]|tara:strand:- start:747 stop:1682 length:936 start_codon:yes stop_codon:yes gene_type:complete
MKVIKLANPRGFCAGVDRAIDIVSEAIDRYGAPIYVRHEVVHNRKVVEDLKTRGAIFVKEISEIPKGAITIFSAHGVSEQVEIDTEKRKLKYFDATCPLVSKVHKEVIRFAESGKDIIMVGHENHPEVEGTLGRFPKGSLGKMYLVEDVDQAKDIEINQPENLCLVTQTTLSVSDTKEIIKELKSRFPLMVEPKSEDICYATQNRQDAVKQLALETEVIIVVGSKNSSNSNRLKELAEKSGTASYLVDDPEQIESKMVHNISSIGVTAGASAPEELVQSIVKKCMTFGYQNVEEIDGLKENIFFKLPAELR